LGKSNRLNLLGRILFKEIVLPGIIIYSDRCYKFAHQFLTPNKKMKRNITLLTIMAMMMGGFAYSQTGRTCGTMEVYHEMMKDPEFAKNIQLINEQAAQYADENANHKEAGATITIPVVVHVVYANNAQNISTTQIQAQINQLNADFSATNTDISTVPSVFQSVIANTNIQFCLAVRDPNGNSTDGIIRKQTTVSSFSLSNAVKYDAQGGSNAWPRDSYLNLWVCNLGSNLLGYAQFPGGTAATDGVVIHYKSVGSIAQPYPGFSPYNLGRTGSHEIGHWLGLYHIWGDASCGNDQVNDTPTAEAPHYGCGTLIHPLHVNMCGAGTSPNGEMFMNYMDYSDDACLKMFTQGQATRMNSILNNARSPLKLSNGCTPLGIANAFDAESAGITFHPNPSQGLVFMNIPENMTGIVKVNVMTSTGSVILTRQVNTRESLKAEFNLSDYANGLYLFDIVFEDRHYSKRISIER